MSNLFSGYHAKSFPRYSRLQPRGLFNTLPEIDSVRVVLVLQACLDELLNNQDGAWYQSRKLGQQMFADAAMERFGVLLRKDFTVTVLGGSPFSYIQQDHRRLIHTSRSHKPASLVRTASCPRSGLHWPSLSPLWVRSWVHD